MCWRSNPPLGVTSKQVTALRKQSQPYTVFILFYFFQAFGSWKLLHYLGCDLFSFTMERILRRWLSWGRVKLCHSAVGVKKSFHLNVTHLQPTASEVLRFDGPTCSPWGKNRRLFFLSVPKCGLMKSQCDWQRNSYSKERKEERQKHLLWRVAAGCSVTFEVSEMENCTLFRLRSTCVWPDWPNRVLQSNNATNIHSYPSDFSSARLARLRLIMKSAGRFPQMADFFFFFFLVLLS